jgi:hypothetical protein
MQICITQKKYISIVYTKHVNVIVHYYIIIISSLDRSGPNLKSLSKLTFVTGQSIYIVKITVLLKTSK